MLKIVMLETSHKIVTIAIMNTTLARNWCIILEKYEIGIYMIITTAILDSVQFYTEVCLLLHVISDLWLIQFSFIIFELLEKFSVFYITELKMRYTYS